MDYLDFFLGALFTIYLVGMGWYLLNTTKEGRDKKAETPAKPKPSKEISRRKRKRRPGKRCPSCKKIIDQRRTVCQHCGYKFESPDKTDPRKDSPETMNSLP